LLVLWVLTLLAWIEGLRAIRSADEGKAEVRRRVAADDLARGTNHYLVRLLFDVSGTLGIPGPARPNGHHRGSLRPGRTDNFISLAARLPRSGTLCRHRMAGLFRTCAHSDVFAQGSPLVASRRDCNTE